MGQAAARPRLQSRAKSCCRASRWCPFPHIPAARLHATRIHTASRKGPGTTPLWRLGRLGRRQSGSHLPKVTDFSVAKVSSFAAGLASQASSLHGARRPEGSSGAQFTALRSHLEVAHLEALSRGPPFHFE